MKSYLILLPIFILALFQGAFLKLNLVLLLVLSWAAFRPPKESLLVAFFSGLLLDLARGTPLGFSSFALLIAGYLLLLYRRRFDPFHPAFLPVFVFLVSSFLSLIFYRHWFWFESFVLALLALSLRYLLVFFIGWIDKERIRLR